MTLDLIQYEEKQKNKHRIVKAIAETLAFIGDHKNGREVLEEKAHALAKSLYSESPLDTSDLFLELLAYFKRRHRLHPCSDYIGILDDPEDVITLKTFVEVFKVGRESIGHHSRYELETIHDYWKNQPLLQPSQHMLMNTLNKLI